MNLQKGVGRPAHSSSDVVDNFFRRTASRSERLAHGKSPRAEKMMV